MDQGMIGSAIQESSPAKQANSTYIDPYPLWAEGRNILPFINPAFVSTYQVQGSEEGGADLGPI